MATPKHCMPEPEAVMLKRQIEQSFPMVEVRLIALRSGYHLSLYHTQRKRMLTIGNSLQWQSVVDVWELNKREDMAS